MIATIATFQAFGFLGFVAIRLFGVNTLFFVVKPLFSLCFAFVFGLVARGVLFGGDIFACMVLDIALLILELDPKVCGGLRSDRRGLYS